MIIRELKASAIMRAGAELRSKVPVAIYENLGAQYPVAQRQPTVRFLLTAIEIATTDITNSKC